MPQLKNYIYHIFRDFYILYIFILADLLLTYGAFFRRTHYYAAFVLRLGGIREVPFTIDASRLARSFGSREGLRTRSG